MPDSVTVVSEWNIPSPLELAQTWGFTLYPCFFSSGFRVKIFHLDGNPQGAHELWRRFFFLAPRRSCWYITSIFRAAPLGRASSVRPIRFQAFRGDDDLQASEAPPDPSLCCVGWLVGVMTCSYELWAPHQGEV